MEKLWINAKPFTGNPQRNYLMALDDNGEIIVYDDIAHAFTSCHRLTQGEQAEVRRAFARRAAEVAEMEARAAERKALVEHVITAGKPAEHCGYSVTMLEDEDDGSWFAVDGPARSIWYGLPGEYWRAPYDREIVARLHALDRRMKEAPLPA